MIHLRARRLLSSLPDGLLRPAVEARVREHAAHCATCRAELRALEQSDALLRRLPRSLVPLRREADAAERLTSLARWGRPPLAAVGSPPTRRVGARSAGFASLARVAPLAATVALALLFGGGTPDGPEEAGGTEAFNFVLASSLATERPAAAAGRPIARPRSLGDDRGQVGRTWIQPPYAFYMPPGAH